MSWAEEAVLEDAMPKDIDFDTGVKKIKKRIKKKNRILGINGLGGTQNDWLVNKAIMSDDSKTIYLDEISPKYIAMASELWYTGSCYYYEYNHNLYICCRYGIYKYDGELFTKIYTFTNQIQTYTTSNCFPNFMYFKNGKAYIYACYNNTNYNVMRQIVDLETGVVTYYNENEQPDVAGFPSSGTYEQGGYNQSAIFVDDDENVYYIYFKAKSIYSAINTSSNVFYINWCLCKRSTDGTFTVIMQQQVNDIWSGIQSMYNSNYFCGSNVLVQEKNNVFKIITYYQSTMSNLSTYYRNRVMFYLDINCNDSNNIIKQKYINLNSALPANFSTNSTYINSGYITNQVTIDAATYFALCVCGSTCFKCINNDVYIFNPGVIWVGRNDWALKEDATRVASPLGGSFIKTSISAILSPYTSDGCSSSDTKPPIVYDRNNNLFPLLSSINTRTAGICCILTDFLESEIENEETLTEYDYESFYV